jgi:N-acetylneuraminic acid mutarotase
MSSAPRVGRLRRQLTLAVALTLTLGTGAVAGAVSATAAPTKTASAPVRQLCAATNRVGYARCFALGRTDIAARPHGVQPNDTPSGYGPADLQDAYQLPSGVAGAGETVAIVDAFDNPDAETDLAVYRAQYGLPSCTTANGCFSKVNQNGDPGPYPSPDPGWAGEIALDVDMVSAACPQCHILLVETDDNFNDNLAAGVDTAVALGAKYVSNSYGGPEDSSQTSLDSSYNHPGIAVTASTGDFGYGAQYPATAPGVTSVGGTSLVQDSTARGWSETAWDGAGSGCSEFTPKPSFQHDPDCSNKTAGDVSAVADPATGVAVYNAFSDGGWVVYGGTSVSSPFIASTYALAGQPVAGTNPESYPYAATSSLYDVTSGSNGSCGGSYLCTAMPGYDGPTGLGTPNGINAFRTGPHGTIRGTVTNSSTHNPVANATVTAGQNATTTAANGTYRLSVPTGTYDMTAGAYGYAKATATGVVVTKNTAVTQDFALDSVPSRTVSGTVTDQSGHHWPLYAKITFAGAPGGPVYTDPFSGEYSVSLASGHTYPATIDAVYPGYASKIVPVHVGSTDIGQDFTLKAQSSCTAPGYTTRYSGLVQHFDTTSKPAGWTVTDNNGSGGVWEFDDPDNRGNQTGGTGNFAIIDSDFIGPGASQDTDLISPPVDLSNDPAPVVGLNSYYKSFFNSVARIDYTINGGSTWHRVFRATQEDQQGPLEFAMPLAANQSNVQVRFHYSGEFAYYWEVDDVYIGHKACGVVKGGLVAGFVRDDNTNQPVNGASVKRADHPADAGVSMATPDTSIPDGFYWLFSSAGGTHPFVASKSKYGSTRKDVNVAVNDVSRQDYRLRAGQLTVNTSAIARTVTLGGAATANLTLHNTGTRPVQVDLGEKPGTFQIAGQPARASYAGVRGAPTHRIAGHYSPLRAAAATGPVRTVSPVPSDDPWQDVADYPTAISDNSASTNDGKVYSVAGIDGNGDEVASLYSYDPGTLTWTQLADMGDTREAPTSNWLNGQLYVVGGWDSVGDPLATTQAYDPGADSWTTVADNPKPFAASGSAVLNGQLYVIGGCDSASCGTTDVEIYDPASNSWSDGPAYPEQTSWIACGAIGPAIFCAGGTNDSSSSTSTYSFDGSSWTQVADMPADAWASASSVANGQLLVSGGAINGSTVLTNEGWSYDPGSDSWTALPNSNNSVYRLGGACGFYKVGGSIGNFQSQSSVEVLPGYDQCGSAGADVTWLAESPKSATLAPGASAQITVKLNSARLAQPGTYTAQLTFGTDTPYQVTPVDVTFTVNPPATWGKVFGKVSGRACDGSVAPIGGAVVQVEGFGGNHTLITSADGTYALWLDQRANPLTLIVAKDGWQPQTRRSAVAPGTPQRENFVLRPVRTCT